jgi:hypothetical protein
MKLAVFACMEIHSGLERLWGHNATAVLTIAPAGTYDTQLGSIGEQQISG